MPIFQIGDAVEANGKIGNVTMLTLRKNINGAEYTIYTVSSFGIVDTYLGHELKHFNRAHIFEDYKK